MLINIIRDGGATKIPKEVADIDAVEALRDRGHEVEVVEVVKPAEPEPAEPAPPAPKAKKAKAA